MLVQMVHTRDVNQLSSQAELALTLVIKTLMLQNRVSTQTRTLKLDERHFLLGTGFQETGVLTLMHTHHNEAS